MSALGVIENAPREGRAVVSCTSAPDIGDAVADSRGRRIGVVARLFGPVDCPYAVVIIDRNAQADGLAGERVYPDRRTHNAKDKRRNRRD